MKVSNRFDTLEMKQQQQPCPCCFGIPEIVEVELISKGFYVKHYHRCRFCEGTGRVTRSLARVFWLRCRPIA